MEAECSRTGSELQTTGAAMWKLRRPNWVLVQGTSISRRSAERRCDQPVTLNVYVGISINQSRMSVFNLGVEGQVLRPWLWLRYWREISRPRTILRPRTCRNVKKITEVSQKWSRIKSSLLIQGQYTEVMIETYIQTKRHTDTLEKITKPDYSTIQQITQKYCKTT